MFQRIYFSILSEFMIKCLKNSMLSLIFESFVILVMITKTILVIVSQEIIATVQFVGQIQISSFNHGIFELDLG